LLLGLLFLFAAPFSSAQVRAHIPRPNAPPVNIILMQAVVQESNNEWRYLKGSAKIETAEMTISADQIDYNDDTSWAYARGHVRLEHFATGDIMNADHAEYNLQTEEGKFYVVDGTAPAKIISSPWVLSTANPFYFKAAWAERIKNRYILHKGFITDCKMPKPWWVFQAPTFDIIPGDRAIAHNPLFRIGKVPILYLPFMYRPLGRNPRQSGFLTPNFGHSTLFGYIYGLGYYWAMSRSYDMTAVGQYFTARGPALLYDFRGKPNESSDFNFNLYSVFDRGITNPQSNTLVKEGGTEFEFTGRTQILGFSGRADVNYLSSFVFREAFSYSFATAILSQVPSVGYLQRHFDHDLYALDIAYERDQLFEQITYPTVCVPDATGRRVCTAQTPNEVLIQKLPTIQSTGRDDELLRGPVPVWFSYQSSAGLLTRQEPTTTAVNPPSPADIFRTGLLGRVDMEPRVATNFDFKGFSLTPSITLGATDYTNSYATNSTSYGGSPCPGCTPISTITVAGANQNLFRKDADFVADLRLPALERIFTPPKWLHLGGKVKHVIEAEATYEYVTGINQFQKIIHFDETDILSNTNQLTGYLTNRIYRKDKSGNVNEVLTWRVAQAHYFDPTFGGAVLPGQRSVVLATDELTPFAFLNGPRPYSPVVSLLGLAPYSFFNIEWRTDYDPVQHKFVVNQYGANAQYKKYFVRFSETSLTGNPLLAPESTQVTFGGGYGNTNRAGWNVAGMADYDVRSGKTLYEFVQGSYNTNCCGFSIQLRRFNIGIRDENQYLFSFSVANIGTFGSLQRQERLF
jgi:LPS-assembly protein